jgi:nicotinate-nucleotide adenylyltransferase
MTRIALFGTSADPPHRGHAAVLRWLATQFDHVAVWTSNNPFKDAPNARSINRFQMLELLIGELDVPPGVVQVHPELSHMRSMVSIERAQQEWPEADFYLVVGSDLVEQLPKWYRADDIFAAVSILVVPRPATPVDEGAGCYLRQRAQVEVATYARPCRCVFFRLPPCRKTIWPSPPLFKLTFPKTSCTHARKTPEKS